MFVLACGVNIRVFQIILWSSESVLCNVRIVCVWCAMFSRNKAGRSDLKQLLLQQRELQRQAHGGVAVNPSDPSGYFMCNKF